MFLPLFPTPLVVCTKIYIFFSLSVFLFFCFSLFLPLPGCISLSFSFSPSISLSSSLSLALSLCSVHFPPFHVSLSSSRFYLSPYLPAVYIVNYVYFSLSTSLSSSLSLSLLCSISPLSLYPPLFFLSLHTSLCFYLFSLRTPTVFVVKYVFQLIFMIVLVDYLIIFL